MKNRRITLKVTASCKSWGGLCTKSEQLKSVLLAKPHSQKKTVKTELTFYHNTHKMDMLAQPDLFELKNTPRLPGKSNDFVDR